MAFPNQPVLSANLPQLILAATLPQVQMAWLCQRGASCIRRRATIPLNAAAGWTIAEFNLVGYGGTVSGVGRRASTLEPTSFQDKDFLRRHCGSELLGGGFHRREE